MLIDEVNKGKKYPKVIRYFGKTKAMTEKYADQYVDELEIYFPEIEKELRRMVKSLTGELSSYMRVWYRGFTIRSKKSFWKMVN
jgi:hypothetical protein